MFFIYLQNNIDNKVTDEVEEVEDVEEVEAEEDTSAQLECHVDNEDSLNLSIGEDEEKLLQYDVSRNIFKNWRFLLPVSYFQSSGNFSRF